MTYDNINEVVNKVFESYQIGLETSMRGSNFIFSSVQVLYYRRHKTNFECSGPYIESPDWIKN